MINYTTPTISLTVEGVDLTGQDIYVTIEQGSHELTKSGADLTVAYADPDTTIEFNLTQEESASFAYSRSAQVQVNWISQNGVRGATTIAQVSVLKNLLDEVIEYGN